MFHRVPIRDVRTLDEVESFLAAGSANVVIFDVDNTLAPQGAPPSDFIELVNAAIDRFEASRGVDRVIALTNGPQRGVERLVARGNKPWTTRRRLDLSDHQVPVVVVGDQLLTDGLLAWRLRATHLHLVIDDQDETPRQARMRRIGAMLAGLFFHRDA